MLLFALATLTKNRTLIIHHSHIFPALKHLGLFQTSCYCHAKLARL